MFEKINLWCEFPDQVNWNKVKKLFDFDCEIFIACDSAKEFERYKKKIKSKKIKLGVWPILPKEEGYWFSGYTSKKNIDKLLEFDKGYSIKIDLEPPLPLFDYSDIKIGLWLAGLLLKRPKNTKYLHKTIYALSKKNRILINEFPFPEWYLKATGMTIETKKNMTKNIMMYSSIPSIFLKHFASCSNWHRLKRLYKKDNSIACSIGLIGTGIFRKEGVYNKVKQFRKDLNIANNIGISQVAIYSLEAILKREKPKEWVQAIKDFTASSCL